MNLFEDVFLKDVKVVRGQKDLGPCWLFATNRRRQLGMNTIVPNRLSYSYQGTCTFFAVYQGKSGGLGTVPWLTDVLGLEELCQLERFLQGSSSLGPYEHNQLNVIGASGDHTLQFGP